MAFLKSFSFKRMAAAFKNNQINLDVHFGEEAAEFGCHGTVVATSPKRGMMNQVIDFVFIGCSVPPPLTPDVLEFIWAIAKKQGYILSHVITYGSENIVTTPSVMYRNRKFNDVKPVAPLSMEDYRTNIRNKGTHRKVVVDMSIVNTNEIGQRVAQRG